MPSTKAKTHAPAVSEKEDLPLPTKRSVKPLNLQIRLSEHLLERIQRQADAKALPASAMARILIMERLNEIEGN
jgi:predicted DNA binding CopG/RHH family protein